MMKGLEDDEGPESSLRKLTQTFGVLGYVILNRSGQTDREKTAADQGDADDRRSCECAPLQRERLSSIAHEMLIRICSLLRFTSPFWPAAAAVPLVVHFDPP